MPSRFSHHGNGFFPGPGGMCVWGSASERVHRPPIILPSFCTFSLHVPFVLVPEPTAQHGERVEGPGSCGLPSGPVQRALRSHRGQHVLLTESLASPAALAEGALPGGRAAARAPSWSCGQIPCTAQVPPASNHLGWRRDELLLQGRKTWSVIQEMVQRLPPLG